MRRAPTWAVIGCTALALFGASELLALIEPPEFSEVANDIADAPIALFLGVGIIVYVFEALLWTVAFTEAGARLFKSARLGAFLGVLAYGVVFHWSGGWFSILASSWIGMVLNLSYLILRERSRKIAILSTIAHKVAFILYATWTLYGGQI